MKRTLLIATLTLSLLTLSLAGCSSANKTDETLKVRHKDVAEEVEIIYESWETDITEPPEPTETDVTVTDVTVDDGLVKVGIINNDPNESGYRTANDMDMKKMFTQENGYDASFFYSLKNDEQISAAAHFIKDDVDYLIISPAGTTGWETVLEDAQDAGIKVIFFDRDPDISEDLYEAKILCDLEKEGEIAVEWLETQDLSEYNIVHLQGVLGSQAQIGRTAPLDSMVDSEDNWNYVAQETAEWNAETAQKIVEGIIDSKEEFNVIYCENDDMAKGAIAALDDAGISHGVGGDVIVISFDCNRYMMEELLNGNINLEVQCSPFQAAYVDAVIRYGAREKTVIVEDRGFDAQTVTQDDVDDYSI
ncbi:MAG: substrate-binding domain-containing protein [Clostridiales bacterium]|nr:substrate-binding domain-containing protein [Clostridiales bacterium]